MSITAAPAAPGRTQAATPGKGTPRARNARHGHGKGLSRSQAQWARSKKTRGQYARERRLALVKLLSPDCKCGICGKKFKLEELEVDHVNGAGWDKRKCNRWTRVARYWREYKEGVALRAACRSCNARRNYRRWQNRRTGT